MPNIGRGVAIGQVVAGGVEGDVPYIAAGSVLAQDRTHLQYDPTAHALSGTFVGDGSGLGGLDIPPPFDIGIDVPAGAAGRVLYVDSDLQVGQSTFLHTDPLTHKVWVADGTFEIRDNTDTPVAWIGPDGVFHGNGASLSGITTGSNLAIGTAVSGGTAKRVLYVDSGGLLAQDADIQWDDATNILKVGSLKVTDATYPSGYSLLSQFGQVNGSYPRGLISGFPGSGTAINYGVYGAAAQSVSSTYIPSFFAASTSASPTDAGGKQFALYQGLTAAVLQTWTAGVPSGTDIYVGGTALDGSTSPLIVRGTGRVVIQGQTGGGVPLSVKPVTSGHTADFYNTSGSVVAYVDSDGKIHGDGSALTGLSSSQMRVYTFCVGVNTPITVGTDKTNWPIVEYNCTATKVFMSAKTAPVGSGIMIDILKSSNSGSTFTSLWATNPNNRPTIPSGAHLAFNTAFDTTALSEGDILRIDVVTIGTSVPGQDITVELKTNS